MESKSKVVLWLSFASDYSPSSCALVAAATAGAAGLGTAEHQFFEEVVADLVAHRPPLVFVDEHPGANVFGSREFDLIAYYRADPRFAAMWTRYEPVGVVGSMRVDRRQNPE